MVHAHQERDHVTGFSAAEAVEGPDPGADVEARRAFVVEGAQALPRTDPGALERHILLDDLAKVCALTDGVDVFAFDQSGHASNLLGGAKC